MSTFKDRLRLILPFMTLIVTAVALTRVIAPGNATWAAALPWVLLALFWVYLAVMLRRDRRRGSAR